MAENTSLRGFDLGIDPNGSTLSLNPKIYSKFGEGQPSADLIVNKERILRMYVENWKPKNSNKTIPTSSSDAHSSSFIKAINSEQLASPINPYIQFFVQSVTTNFSETISPMKNITSGFTTYSFGQEPPVFSFSGVLANTYFDNWAQTFLSLYHHFLRAPKLAELNLLHNTKPLNRYQIVIKYQEKTLKGSLISMMEMENANIEQAVQFQFQFLCKELIFDWGQTAEATTLYKESVGGSRKVTTRNPGASVTATDVDGTNNNSWSSSILNIVNQIPRGN